MPKESHTYQFTVDVGGKEYDCRRVVTGTQVLYQSIVVEGIDSEPDTARYGPKQPRMERMAKQIAIDLICKHLSKKSNS
ncbi:MAG: hypothetical protein WCJ35_11565 [Planctomycetota bacterium]